ncbi:MAG: hypothetical protein KatS3mg054_0009 [Chloroflexus sp.]|nr:MAG: hypothetical protein KatS3mg054_0009 [Chloroflexus sp.]
MHTYSALKKFPTHTNMDIIKTIEANYATLAGGVPTLIPFPWDDLNAIVPGLIRADRVIITANSGVGKSKFTRFLGMKYIKRFCNKHSIACNIYINSLEEDPAKVYSSIYISAMNKTFGISIDYYDFMGYKVKAGSDDLRSKIDKIISGVDLSDIKIVQMYDPIAFYRYVIHDLAAHGTFYDRKGASVDPDRVASDDNSWVRYVPDTPRINVIITDTIDAMLDREGKSYDTIITYTAHYCRALLSLRAGCIHFWVQQQSAENETRKFTNSGQLIVSGMKPDLGKLLSAKATQQYANLVLGLFSPHDAGLKTYQGHQIHRFSPRYRLYEVIVLKANEGRKPKGSSLLLVGDLLEEEYYPCPDPNDEQIIKYYD